MISWGLRGEWGQWSLSGGVEVSSFSPLFDDSIGTSSARAHMAYDYELYLIYRMNVVIVLANDSVDMKCGEGVKRDVEANLSFLLMRRCEGRRSRGYTMGGDGCHFHVQFEKGFVAV